MARISTYVQDDNLSKGDKFLGSDSGGATRNFSIASVSDFFKQTNGAGVAGQLTYKNSTVTPNNESMRFFYDSGSENLFSGVNKIRVNKFAKGDTLNDVVNMLTIFDKKNIILIDTANQNNHGVYEVLSVAQVGSTNNYDLSLNYTGTGNGNISNTGVYAFSAFSGGADKHEELEFTSSTFVRVAGDLQFETINGSNMCYIDFEHKLNKKPSISAEQEGSPGQVALMPVKYIDNNKVRVYFGGTTSGKIFAN